MCNPTFTSYGQSAENRPPPAGRSFPRILHSDVQLLLLQQLVKKTKRQLKQTILIETYHIFTITLPFRQELAACFMQIGKVMRLALCLALCRPKYRITQMRLHSHFSVRFYTHGLSTARCNSVSSSKFATWSLSTASLVPFILPRQGCCC